MFTPKTVIRENHGKPASYLDYYENMLRKSEKYKWFLESLGQFLPVMHYASFEDFKEKFAKIAMSIQGSGWVYLARNGNIKTIKNHQIKSDIVLLVDWWEHAWALDYQADKAGYLKNIWRIINWDIVNARLSTIG